MLIYGPGDLTALDNGQPVAPLATQANQVGSGFASVTIMNESPWGFAFVNASSGSFPIIPWAVATIPVSPGDSWQIQPEDPLFLDGNYVMPPGVANEQTQLVAQFSRTSSVYSIRQLFTMTVAEISGTTQVTVDTTGGPVDVSGTVSIGNTPSVTVSSGTIDIGNTPSVTVSSGTIDIGNTPSVTIASGTVDVSIGDVTITSGQGGVNVSVETVPQALGNIVGDASGDGVASLTVTPPSGATGIRVLVYSAASDYAVGGVGVVGATSGYDYGADIGTLFLTGPAQFDFSCNSNFEQLLITIEPFGAGKIPAGQVMGQAFALFTGQAVSPINDTYTPLAIGTGTPGNATQAWPVDAKGNPITSPMGTQGRNGNSVQIVSTPPQYSGPVGYNATAGGTQLLIPAPPSNQSIRLRAVHLTAQPTGYAQALLESPSGTPIGASALCLGNPYDIPDYHSYQLPAGTGLYLYTYSAGLVAGTILYDVY